ncbi:c-type cytochrome domain-containing protein [Jiulongibacter sp. NS-SX5]|uniref:c-type cytochrome domain-containing protein n=1 Tax=Jiulongibacter sp. NS-SX5 TaxID=3463854 RepID=UPI0040592C07
MEYLLIFLTGLLLILLIFQNSFEIPNLLKPLGRMHPLVLHLPIGVFFICCLALIFRKEFPDELFSRVFGILTILNAFFGVLTALLGLFLSIEPGYDADALYWHKWWGAAFAIEATLLYFFHNRFSNSRLILSAGLTFVILLITGHLGAEITHGENFLFESWAKEEEESFDANKPVYTAAVLPILESKCFACHNDQKQKGRLNMSSIELMLKGGKNGPLWVAGDAINSHLTERIKLPMEEKKHMPPKGKPQLSTDEIAILVNWIQEGADTSKTTLELPEKSELRAAVEKKYFSEKEKSYDFTAADESVIAEVSSPFLKIEPLALNSPALRASFFVRQKFENDKLQQLGQLAEQIVSLNLNKMPVTDEDLANLSKFKNLESLYLNQTDITGEGLKNLQGLENLNHLSLAGCKLETSSIDILKELSFLTDLYVWDTGIPAEKWHSEFQGVNIHTGYEADPNEIIKLNTPLVENKNKVLKNGEKVVLKHTLPNVKIVYTTDYTEPDTLSGNVYQEPIVFKDHGHIKARAVKDGWLASDLVSFSFFSSVYKALSSKLLTQTNKQYPGKGAQTVIDQKAGDIDNFKDGSWLGFKENNAEILIEPGSEAKGLTFSYLIDAGSYIMPPVSVELWGGNAPESLQKIARKTPDQLSGYVTKKAEGISFEFEKDYKYLKIIAKPIRKLPNWHRGRGDKGWVFTDEIYLW